VSISNPPDQASPAPASRFRSRSRARGGGGAKIGQDVPEARRRQARESLAQVESVSGRWLRDGDGLPTRAVLATYLATMRLGGAGSTVPCLMVVGGSSSGKTERVSVLAGLPGIIAVSSPKGEASFLSGTAIKDRAKDATGGLLNQIGTGPGIIIIKDFTSILSKSDTARSEIIAAIRESADGSWTRPIGVDGGKILAWNGRAGYIGACTDEIDRSHTSLAIMGQRFLFIRIPDNDLLEAARFKIENLDYEEKVTQEIRGAVHHCLTGPLAESHLLTNKKDVNRMANLATLVSVSRSAVHWDKWKREIEMIPKPEAPPRVAAQLSRIWQAGGMLGLTESECWDIVSRLALDSIPYLRGAVLRAIAGSPEPVTEAAIRASCGQPRASCQRALSELAAHGVAEHDSPGERKVKHWTLTGTARGWLSASGACPIFAPPPPRARARAAQDGQDGPGRTRVDRRGLPVGQGRQDGSRERPGGER
jgi:hypothetical protein